MKNGKTNGWQKGSSFRVKASVASILVLTVCEVVKYMHYITTVT